MNWSTVLICRGWALLVLCAFAVPVDSLGWNRWLAVVPLLALPAVYAYIKQPNDEPPAQATQFYRLAPALFVGILVVQWVLERRVNPAYAMGMASLIPGLGLIATGIRLRTRRQQA